MVTFALSLGKPINRGEKVHLEIESAMKGWIEELNGMLAKLPKVAFCVVQIYVFVVFYGIHNISVLF